MKDLIFIAGWSLLLVATVYVFCGILDGYITLSPLDLTKAWRML